MIEIASRGIAASSNHCHPALRCGSVVLTRTKQRCASTLAVELKEDPIPYRVGKVSRYPFVRYYLGRAIVRDDLICLSSIRIVDSFLGETVKRKTENQVVWKGCISLPIAMVNFLAERGPNRSGTIAKMIAASAAYKTWIKEQAK